MTRTALLASIALAFAAGCGGADTEPTGGSGSGGTAGGGGLAEVGCDPAAAPSQTISCIVSFSPGDGAGFGQDRFPDVVFGPPVGKGEKGGSLDVLSLGKGGEIVLGFGGGVIVDGDGPDLVIFENPFYYGSSEPKPIFKELAEVSVSEDGETWVTFPCKKETYPFDGCAGWHPVLSNPDNGISPFDPAVSGGDPFDLADVGVSRARLVRVRDLGNPGGGGEAGFDLDAAAILHPEE